MLRYTSRILDHLAHASYRPSPEDDIAKQMRVDRDDREVFAEAVAALVTEKRVDLGTDGRLRLPEMPDEIVGRFRLNERGFGFVIPDTPYRDGDLFVPPGGARDAVSGDRVRAAVRRQDSRRKGKPERSGFVGRIVEVLERGQEQFVGVLVKKGRSWLVEPDGRTLYDAVVVRDPHAKNAKAGDKVVIELLHYPDEDYHAEGVITKVLGTAGRPDVETQAVIEAHGLRTEFPDAIVADAREAVRTFDPDSAAAEREDLRDGFIFTIDPPDARDFDDAISIEHDAKAGEWTLGVHIADVASFVKPDGPLDKEASARGNSVYLPRLVIPMLPEALSNGVCSLQEGVARCTKSVFITFDQKGRVVGQRAAATIIESRKRLTYIEAQALINGDVKTARKNARTEPVYTDELIEKLQLSRQLAEILQRRRRRDGMIVLQLPEVELVFDDDGHVIDAVPEDNAYTHTIIEMFMVEANEAVARMFDAIRVPVLRRIHPEPRYGALEELQMYARAAQVRIPEEPTRFDLQRVLDMTRDTPASRAMHFAVLRTLTKAIYSPALIGHFALASDHYAHFTSPIRRYPDLVVHRALEALLERTDNGQKRPGGRKRDALGAAVRGDDRVADEGRLIELGRHCSETEREAEAAERALRAFLVMQYLAEHHLGAEFPGVVTGVAGKGVFVSIERFLVEGLVAMKDLPSSGDRADRWSVDPSTGRLVAQRSGLAIGIGDVVTVQIAAVDLASRHLDLALVKYPERRAAPTDRKRGAPRPSKPKRGGRRSRR